MIKLIVGNYCQKGCKDFVAHVETKSKPLDSNTDHIITCEFWSRCRAMMKYLEDIRKGDDDDQG